MSRYLLLSLSLMLALTGLTSCGAGGSSGAATTTHSSQNAEFATRYHQAASATHSKGAGEQAGASLVTDVLAARSASEKLDKQMSGSSGSS